MTDAVKPNTIYQPKAGEFLSDGPNDAHGNSVMISYSRKDKAFVKNIYDSLVIDDRSIWVSQSYSIYIVITLIITYNTLLIVYAYLMTIY